MEDIPILSFAHFSKKGFAVTQDLNQDINLFLALLCSVKSFEEARAEAVLAYHIVSQQRIIVKGHCQKICPSKAFRK